MRDDKLFTVVEFNLANYCNRNCSFCPSKPKNEKLFLDKNTYIKVINDIYSVDPKYSGVICYSGFSESLLYPDLISIISITKNILKYSKIELMTNGDYLNSSILKNIFEAGLDVLNISVYSQNDENHIKNINGLDKYNVIQRIRYGENDRTVWNNVAGYITDYNELNITRVCYYPFYLIYINYNGNVGFCCNNYTEEYNIGNIKEKNIKDLWYSDKMLELRKMLINNERKIKPCSLCDVNGLLKGKDKFKLWNNI